MCYILFLFFFFFNDTATTEIYTLSLHDALPIYGRTASESRDLDFSPWGGAYNRTSPDATAFVHRDALFVLKHGLVVDPGTPAGVRESARRWLARSWASVHPLGHRRRVPELPGPG